MGPRRSATRPARTDLPRLPGCPHDLGDLAAATRGVVAADKADPALRLDSGAITGILEIARAEVRRGRRIPMEQLRPGAAGDELTVSEQTLANLIRRTSDEIDGLEARRCAVALSKHDPLNEMRQDSTRASLRRLRRPPRSPSICESALPRTRPSLPSPACCGSAAYSHRT